MNKSESKALQTSGLIVMLVGFMISVIFGTEFNLSRYTMYFVPAVPLILGIIVYAIGVYKEPGSDNKKQKVGSVE